MGLLGNTDDSLSTSSGWGVLPPINSSADWGSSSSSTVNNNTSTISSQSNINNQVSSANMNSSNINQWQSAIGSSSNSRSISQNRPNIDQTLLSSSPKPLSSWAQAAGKGLTNSSSHTSAASGSIPNSASNNGPNSSNPSSHDSYSMNSNHPGNVGIAASGVTSNTTSSANLTNANSNNGQNGIINPGGGNAFQSSNTTAASAGGSGNLNSCGSNNGGLVNDAKIRAGNGASNANLNEIIGQLNEEFRETLLTDNWGSSVINQDSPWNLPPSPQSSPKDTSTWRCPVNSGTEIWENTVRQKKGSVSSASAVSSTTANALNSAQPWAQAPTTHIGGTWGEEEDSSNHWTGVPQPINSVSGNSSINNWSTGVSNGGNSNPNPISNNTSNSSSSNVNMNHTHSSNNSWNGSEKNSFCESRSKPSNWGNFDHTDSAAPENWEKVNDNFGTWNAEAPKKESAWEKESNESYKASVDDGTAVWGNPVRQNKVSNWKENKYGNNNPNNNNRNGMSTWNNGNGAGGNGNGGNKSNQMLSRTWTDASTHRKSPSLWNDDTKSLNGLGTGPCANMTPNNWSDGQVDTSGWCGSGNKHTGSNKQRDNSYPTKPFRVLMEMGYKKEDVETALRNNQMRIEDALFELRAMAGYDDLNRFKGNQQMNSALGNQIKPRQIGSMLNSQQNQLQSLVQRIQLAVSTGYLNPQILNQPLSNQNLEIISELLQQIKILQTLQSQLNGATPNTNQQMKISQIKQTIANLQNQLQMPNQPQSIANSVGLGGANKSALHAQSNDFFKANNDNTIYGSGSGSGMDFAQHGSRLHSWKQSTYNKNDDKINLLNNDFVRAPGPLSKQNSSNNWGNFTPDDSGWDIPQLQSKHDKELPGQSSLIDDYQIADFRVQDFDYKTWKPAGVTANSGAKGLEDDPRSPLSNNNIMKDSMFSWNNNKNLLNNNSANSDPLNSFFPSNTWSYNLNSQSNSQMFNVDLNKKSLKSTWGNQLTTATDYINSDNIWNTPGNGGNTGAAGSGNAISKPRPPPGLSQVKNSANSNNSNSNIWNSGLSSSSTSEYLRLRNLTPQIDGSTLKTLCVQHGPLLLFHLFLNHGIAIARYANRDQAIKAQSALNNCVLSNTTILADMPPESEVQQYMHLISGQQMSTNSNNHHALSSWSNGTNASQHTAAAANSVIGQSSSLYARSNNSAAATAHIASFGNSNITNVTSPASTLPYGGGNGGAGGSALTTHSSHSLPYSALNNANNAFNTNAATAAAVGKLDTSPGWNTGSNSLWDMQNSNSSLGGGGSSLWSTAGFSAADRNTPLQNFLPGDLLAGENN